MIVIWFVIFGGASLVAFLSAAIGFLCTKSIRDVVPGLLFGLPATILSLPLFVLGCELGGSGVPLLFLFSGLTAVPLFLGSLVLCRSFQTGRKQRDFAAGMLVSVGIFLFGILLSEHHDLTDAILIHLLGMPSIA